MNGNCEKKKILFLIHDLGHGGAEKVLVNLVNNMDREKFDITVMSLFGGGVNERFLLPHIHYRTVFSRTVRGNSHMMKLLTPRQLHKWFIKEQYDIEVAYLEGPSARIISGCPHKETKLISWIHCTMRSNREFCRSFRSLREAQTCYSRFHKNVFVAKTNMEAFTQCCPVCNGVVLYNTNESGRIMQQAEEPVEDIELRNDEVKLIGAGKIEPVKGFDRLARIHCRLKREGYPVHTYILGEGSKKSEILDFLNAEGISDSFTFLGYQTNPYRFMKKCDLFVCSSHSEGFSTAATEALIVGTPVCTVEVSGMKEMLGEHNEWGVVTENDGEALYRGIKRLLDDPVLLAYYKEKAAERGKTFSMENTVQAVEKMMEGI